MLTNEQIAEILDTAADDIAANGWQHFFPAQHSRPYLHGGPGAMSALGAIQNVITGSPSRWDTPSGDPRHDDIDQVMGWLNQRFVRLNPDDLIAESFEPFMAWHSETDFPGFRPRRDKAEILVFLRAAAEELRTSPDQDGDADDGAEDEGHRDVACPTCHEPVPEFPPTRVPAGCPRNGGPDCAVIEDFGDVLPDPDGCHDADGRDDANGGKR